jgi:response regulator NasT
MLTVASINKIIVSQSCSEARRLLLEWDFDLVIINSPLKDETGESFSRHIAGKGVSQVILVVKSEYFDAITTVCERDGILTVSKPMNRAVFWSVLMLAKSAQKKMKQTQAENVQLREKIANIRIIDRAKSILISCMNMNEQEAHRYIEKQAMDKRSTRREIAEGIIKTYEN